MRQARPCVIVLAVCLSGCAAHTAAWDAGPLPDPFATVSPATRVAAARHIAEGETAFAGRTDPVKLGRAIRAWRAAVALDPQDHRTWTRLARAELFLARGLHRGRARTRALAAALGDAEHALMAADPALVQRLRRGDAFADAVKVAGPEAAPALYWYAASVDAWSRSAWVTVHLADHARVAAAMRQVAAVAPATWHGGALAWLAEDAVRAGELELGGRLFRGAVSRASGLLEIRVRLAATLAVGLGDRRLFDAELAFVENADATVPASLVPENRRAQAEARALAARARGLFRHRPVRALGARLTTLLECGGPCAAPSRSSPSP